jgi:hypothetical protein
VIFPLKDDIPSRSWPIATVTVLAHNLVVFH